MGLVEAGQRVFPAATRSMSGKPDVDFWFDRGECHAIQRC